MRHRMMFLLKQLGVAAIYALLIYLDHRYFESGTPISSFEASIGFAFAVLLIGGKRYAWGVLLGATLIGVTTDPLGAAVIKGSGDTLEALCGAWLLTRDSKFFPGLRSLRDYLKLILFGAAGIGIASNLECAALLVFGYIDSGGYSQELLHRWSGDILGIALVTPLVITGMRTENKWSAMKMAEVALLLGMTFLAGQVVFLGWLHDNLGNFARGYVMFLFITWVAVRLGTRGAAIAIAVVGVQSTLSTFQGVGYFGNDIAESGMANYWIYMLILSVVGMALATFLEALHRSETKFRMLYDSTGEAMLLMDEKDFIGCNNAALQMFGCATKEEFCSKHPTDLSPSQQLCGTDSFVLANQHIATAMEKGNHRFEWVCKRLDTGKTFIVDMLLSAMELDGKTVLQAVARDITERKAIEEELLESRSQLQATLDAIPDLLFEVGLDGRYHECHVSRTELLAAPTEVLIGKTVHEILPREAADIVMLALREAHEKGSSFGRQFELPLPQGMSWFELSVSRKITHAGMEPSFIVLSRDITDRKHIEDELRLTKERYDFATAIGRVGTWDWSPVTGILAWSDETFRLMGFAPGFVTPSYELFLSLVHPDDRAFINSAVQAALYDRKSYDLDCRVVIGSGNELVCHVNGKIEFDAEGQPVRMLGTIQDITERKRAEAALRESEERLRGIMNNASAVIFLKDTAGRYLLVNPLFEKLFHISNAAIQEKTDHDIFPKDMADAFVAADKKVIQAGQSLEVEERVPQDDGIHTYISVKFPLHNASGEIYAVCGIATDITERKAAEQQLHALSAHIQKVREEEKAHIAREIHDELGGTLSTLKMDAYWLSRKLPANNEGAALVERLGLMSQRINSAVHFTRRIISDLRPSILDDLGMLAAIEWLAENFQAGTGIKCKVSCIEDETDLDERYSIVLFRVLQEALNNISRHSGASEVEIKFNHGEEKVVLEVSDNGCGIRESQEMTPATHASKSYGMLGMVERVTQLGGAIFFSSPPSGGFSLVVDLPLLAKEKCAK